MSPPAPEVASPLDMIKLPVLPFVLSPVDIVNAPLTPLLPLLAVVIDTAPDAVVEAPLPDVMLMLPPTDDEPFPPNNDTAPPDVLPDPLLKVKAPPLPEVEAPPLIVVLPPFADEERPAVRDARPPSPADDEPLLKVI